MKVLLADDHEVVRRGLKQILADEFGKVSFGEAANAAQTLELAWKQKWDLVVLDINMPGRSGLEVLAELKQSRPKLPVLMLSMAPEAEYATRALKSGAAGYLNKQSAGAELVVAVKRVLAGGRYITPALAETLVAELQQGVSKPPHEKLSDREYQVMKMIAAGRNVKQIAAALALSEKTVFTYRSRLLAKLRLNSDVELTRYAMRHRLAE